MSRMREIEPPMGDLPPGFSAAPGGGGEGLPMGGMSGLPGGLPGAGGRGPMTAEQAEARKAQQEEMEAQRQFMLDQILTPEAKERLSRIAIVRKEKARAVEDMLLGAATSGRLPGKVTEEQLIKMLEQVSSQVERKSTKVTIQRRAYFDDDGDDDNDDDLL